MSLKNFKLGEKLENYFLLYLDEYIEKKKILFEIHFFLKFLKLLNFFFLLINEQALTTTRSF